jgi:hypothetical protein
MQSERVGLPPLERYPSRDLDVDRLKLVFAYCLQALDLQ